MTDDDTPIELAAAVAIVLGDRRRPLILQLLERGPSTAAALAERLGIAPAAVAHHLTVLRSYGWVHVAGTEGEGRRCARLWAANPGLSWAQVTEDLNALSTQRDRLCGPKDTDR